jgi:hypothetical protein
MPVFKTGAINHSANSPHIYLNRLSESEFGPLRSEMRENDRIVRLAKLKAEKRERAMPSPENLEWR